MSKRQRVNNQISVSQVRVIGADSEQMGVMDTQRALQIARDSGLDLVEVSPLADPPVCRILDFGAFLYQQEKKDRKQRAKQKRVEMKGIRISLKIGPHDLDVRKKQAHKFLEKGNKVKVELILRGRERAFADRAAGLLRGFADSLLEEQNLYVEKDTSKQGNRLFMIISKK